MSKKIKVRVVSIWWDDVKRICSDVERKQEVSINDGEMDVEIEVEMSKRWELDMIFWVAQSVRYITHNSCAISVVPSFNRLWAQISV